MIKRLLVGTATVTATIVLTSGSAWAHFCSQDQRPDKANQAVAKSSQGWKTYSQMLAEFGMCEDGVAHVAANAPESIPLDVLVNSHATMGGGTFDAPGDPGQPEPFQYVEATEAEWLAFEAAIEEGFAICESA